MLLEIVGVKERIVSSLLFKRLNQYTYSIAKGDCVIRRWRGRRVIAGAQKGGMAKSGSQQLQSEGAREWTEYAPELEGSWGYAGMGLYSWRKA